MKINKYPDGSSYVNEISSDHLTFKINSYEDLWHLNQYVDAFYDKFKFKPYITIPHLFDSQADRRFNKGESSGLKLVCKFLNNMGCKFKIFHPHNPEIVEALIDNVEIIDNSKFIDNVLCKYFGYDESEEYSHTDNLILTSSDAGGFKSLMKLCDRIGWRGETYSASKSRKYENGKSKLIQQVDRKDFKGKDVLLIDDISVYGGTFKGLSKLLKERNCGKLYLAVSHMTIQNLGNDPVTNYFDKVFTTNSKFDNYYGNFSNLGKQNLVLDNLEIIKMFDI